MIEGPSPDVCLPLLTMKSTNFNPLNNYQIGIVTFNRKNSGIGYFWEGKTRNTQTDQ